MKTIHILASALVLFGTTPCFSSNNENIIIESEIFGRRLPNKKSKNDKRKDRNNHNTELATNVKGEKGDKGDPGESLSVVHGYYYKSNSDDVSSKSAILFDTIGVETGDLNYDPSHGSLIIPEDGSYQITYNVDAQTGNPIACAVQINECSIVPGSLYKSNSESRGNIVGSLILKAKKDDQLKVINVSEETLQFDNSIFSNVNASLTIKKLD